MSNPQIFEEKEYSLPRSRLVPLEVEEALWWGSCLPLLEPWSRLGYSAEAVCHYLLRTDPALRRYAIFVKDRRAGVVCVRHPWLMGPFLELICILDDYRGCGIGHDVINWMEMQGGGGSGRNLWTTVSSFNTQAIRFYEGAGFCQVAPLPDLVRAGFTEILMRSRLNC